jgi:hypothetical protein
MLRRRTFVVFESVVSSFETVTIDPPVVPVVDAIILTVRDGVVVPIPSFEPRVIFVFANFVVPVAVKFVVAILLEVAFVRVAFVAVIPTTDRIFAHKFCTFAQEIDEEEIVTVAIEEVPVEFNVTVFVVVELLVEAFEVSKFDVVPHRVPIKAEVMFAKIADKPVVVVVADTDKLVVVAFVIVPLEEAKFVLVRLVIEEFVDVAFVIVPFATLIDGRDKFVTERFVIVAFVRVALLEVKYDVEAVKIFPTSEFVVVAFVVEAFKVAKFPVVPHRVVIVARVEFSVEIKAEVIFANVPEIPTDVVVAETDKLVAVAFVIVPLEEAKFVLVRLVIEELVEVELVIVAFVKETPSKLRVPTFRFEIVALAIVVVEIVVVPIRFVVEVEIIEPAINLPLAVVDASEVEPVDIRVVAFTFIIFATSVLVVVAFVVDAFSVAKLAVVPHNVVMVASVELRVEIIAEVIFANVPEIPTDVVVAETDKFVDVEFVIVPLATLIEGRDKFVTERFVIVAAVMVELVTTSLEIFALEILEVEALEVVAFVVDAFKFWKLPVVPQSVVM